MFPDFCQDVPNPGGAQKFCAKIVCRHFAAPMNRRLANRNLQTVFREFLDKGLKMGWPESLCKSQITLFKSPSICSQMKAQESSAYKRLDLPESAGFGLMANKPKNKETNIFLNECWL